MLCTQCTRKRVPILSLLKCYRCNFRCRIRQCPHLINRSITIVSFDLSFFNCFIILLLILEINTTAVYIRRQELLYRIYLLVLQKSFF